MNSCPPEGPARIVTNREIYRCVIETAVPQANQFLWLATADLKDMYVKDGPRMVPFLGVLSRLVDRGVAVRLLHAKEPGPAFRRDFDRYPNLLQGMEMILCPRVHLKAVVADGSFAYLGSANLTGAGMGAKSSDRRNFEAGITTTDAGLIGQIMTLFDDIWMGAHCRTCGRKAYCAAFAELIGSED